MIHIPSNSLKAAGRLLKRLRQKGNTLPVLDYVCIDADPRGLVRLTVTTLDQWLETRIDTEPGTPERLLLPKSAFDAALKADRGSSVAISRIGPKRKPRVRLTLTRGGIRVETDHPTLDPADFPATPQPPRQARATTVTGELLDGIRRVSPCASKDPTRYILNSVLLTPEEGGRVVATDGRRLAATPAEVPDARMALPIPAIHALAGIQAGTLSMTPFTALSEGGEEQPDPKQAVPPDHLQIEAGDHTLVTRLIDGHFPGWQQVIPREEKARATFGENHRAAVIDWLRSLGKRGREVPVELRPGKSGHLELSRGRLTSEGTRIEVPADIHGKPQPVALNAAYLADALEIAPTLAFIDEMNPVVARDPDGTLCVVMPMRIGTAAAA